MCVFMCVYVYAQNENIFWNVLAFVILHLLIDQVSLAADAR